MYQLMILDQCNNIIGVCTNDRELPNVCKLYPDGNYVGIEVPYNPELIDHYYIYYYSGGKFIKKPLVDYRITKTCISTSEFTTIIVPENTTAIVDDMVYEIEDGTIEYSNPNTGYHKIILRLPNHLDTIVEIEVIEA